MKKYIILLAIALVACGGPSKPKTNRANVYEVKPQAVHNALHFTGTIQPMQETTLVSPMEAVVETMNFHYGQMVHQGDVVMKLNSTDLQKQYNDTLTEYLKAKDNYSTTKSKFIGTQELWDAGLISKNNYLSEKSGVTNARVSLIQAKRKLTELLNKMDDKNADHVAELSLADFEKVKEALATSHNIIRLKAPSDGVLLYPPKTTDDKTARIGVGAVVKPGQAIALVGNLKGISIEIDVPEIDIDKIRAGLDATVTGVAFGNHQLKGKVIAVNAQATNTGGGGLPSFTAVVEVRSLTKEEQAWVKVGMSAAIEVNIDSHDQLLVPIAAISREKSKSMVKVLQPDGKEASQTIITGPALAEAVVVQSGLKAGDVVVYD